jgi:hypothetical protein
MKVLIVKTKHNNNATQFRQQHKACNRQKLIKYTIKYTKTKQNKTKTKPNYTKNNGSTHVPAQKKCPQKRMFLPSKFRNSHMTFAAVTQPAEERCLSAPLTLEGESSLSCLVGIGTPVSAHNGMALYFAL